jgi:hypothetical protein
MDHITAGNKLRRESLRRRLLTQTPRSNRSLKSLGGAQEFAAFDFYLHRRLPATDR